MLKAENTKVCENVMCRGEYWYGGSRSEMWVTIDSFSEVNVLSMMSDSKQNLCIAKVCKMCQYGYPPLSHFGTFIISNTINANNYKYSN